eukprot:4389443-Amphidinium_carterae.1
MPLTMLTQRQIQKDMNEAYVEENSGTPLGSWRTCRPQGATPHSRGRKRTSFVSFDMVAELAIAERFIGLASLLASIVVTRA